MNYLPNILIAWISLVLANPACSDTTEAPFRVLLSVSSYDIPRPEEFVVDFRVVLVGNMGKETTVATNFEPVTPAILSGDGTKLTLLLSRFNSYIRHKGVEYRVDTPAERMGLAKVNGRTVAFLNKKGEISVNVAKMPKLKTVQVTYFVESGTDQSPFWRGELVTVFDVKRDARGYPLFGDGLSLGTCEGKVTLCTPPYRPGENYRYPSKTSTSGDKTTNGPEKSDQQSANDNGAPAAHDETSHKSRSATEPHQPPEGQPGAKP